MSKRRWLLPLLLSLPLAAFILFLGGCLPVGLGDPEASKVDAKLVGVWEEIVNGVPKGAFVVLLPFDGRAYLMRTVAIERTADGIEVKPGEGCYKAWVTAIGGQTFLTAQPLYLKEALGDAKVPGFFVLRVDLAADGSKLKGWAINGDFEPLAPLAKLPGHMSYEPPPAGEKTLTEEEARALLRKVIEENAGAEDLYDGTADYARVTDKAVLKALFEGVIG